MGFFNRKEKLTEEQKLTKKQQELTQRQINELKRARRGSGEQLGKLLGSLGNAFPKGIKNPDDTIRNLHLYVPGKGRKKTDLR